MLFFKQFYQRIKELLPKRFNQGELQRIWKFVFNDKKQIDFLEFDNVFGWHAMERLLQ
jgi:hypothetical protein